MDVFTLAQYLRGFLERLFLVVHIMFTVSDFPVCPEIEDTDRLHETVQTDTAEPKDTVALANSTVQPKDPVVLAISAVQPDIAKDDVEVRENKRPEDVMIPSLKSTGTIREMVEDDLGSPRMDFCNWVQFEEEVDGENVVENGNDYISGCYDSATGKIEWQGKYVYTQISQVCIFSS